MRITPHYRPIRLPFGLLLTVAIRTRPLGVGMTLWTRREQDECRLVRHNRTETMKKTA